MLSIAVWRSRRVFFPPPFAGVEPLQIQITRSGEGDR
jgi:hypothetical protein